MPNFYNFAQTVKRELKEFGKRVYAFEGVCCRPVLDFVDYFHSHLGSVLSHFC